MNYILNLLKKTIFPNKNNKKYWKERKNKKYYSKVIDICKTYTKNAKSVIDIGSKDCEYILDLKWIKDKTALDIEFLPKNEEIKKIKADFLTFKTDKKYDLVLCMQVLEHLEKPSDFSKKLFDIGNKVIISVPYMWPEGSCSEHLHDLIDKDKLFSWTNKKPTYSIIVKENENSPKSKRLIAYYE